MFLPLIKNEDGSVTLLTKEEYIEKHGIDAWREANKAANEAFVDAMCLLESDLSSEELEKLSDEEFDKLTEECKNKIFDKDNVHKK